MKNFTKEIACNADKLKALFEPHGAVTDAQIKTRDDGKFLGLGYIVFSSEEDAKKAIGAMHEKEFDGKKLSVVPAVRRVDDSDKDHWSGYYNSFSLTKGKGKGKGKAMMQQYFAMQAAYSAAYSQMWSASMAGGNTDEKRVSNDNDSSVAPAVPNEQVAPGEYTGTLKHRMRYGQKKSYIVSPTTYQYYGADIHIEKETIPTGAKDGDSIKFTVAAAYGQAKWDDKSGWTTPYARGYPKAKTALVSPTSKADGKV